MVHFAGGMAMADGISGSVELLGSTTDSKSTDASGLSTTSKSNTFFQRYQLNYTEALFPYVNLRAGISYDKTMTESTDATGETRSADTNLFPSAALTFNNPFVSSGVGYSKREEKIESTGVSPVTNIMETMNAFLGLRPLGLPTLDMQFTRSHLFDTAYQTTDIVNDLFSASTQYTPVKNLDLGYSVTLNNNNDRLNNVEFDSVSQNERAAYSNRFFDNRVAFSANYNGSQSTSETSSGGGGKVNFQLFPFSGLSSISDTPTLDTLSPNQALIDGNLTASSGINIGRGVSLGGDLRLRNVGLDFVSTTAVNTLYVYVDRQLPTSVSNAFTWYIYTSSDNQNWTLYNTITPATFNPFFNRFELLFPDVTTRYIKASVRPLPVSVVPPPGTDISNIYITELQSFISKASAQVAGQSTSRIEFYDVSVRTSLLQDRSLVYSIYYSQANRSGGSSTSLLSNALSINRQLSTIFSAMARIQRDDTRDVTGNSTTYIGTTSLMAAPLPTLSHSLVLSYRSQETPGLTSSSESVFLNNTAALYPGIDVNLSGGINFASDTTGATTNSTLINAGASIVPNKSLSMGVNHSETESTQSQIGTNRAVSTTANVAWSPFATVYLAYSISMTSAAGVQSQTLQSYAANWAPFAGGALAFSLGYSETLDSTNMSVDRALTTGMEWRVGPRIYFTAAYSITESKASSQSTEAKILSTDLRMSF